MKTSSINSLTTVCLSGILLLGLTASTAVAYERYYNDNEDPGSNCSQCHGDFTGTNSPIGTIFPSGNKHEMHRAGANMDTACNLCHTNGDGRNPFMGSSQGTTANPVGLGCSGCHVGPGLRKHHYLNNISGCYDQATGCHGTDPQAEVSAPENVPPPYYGTVDTKVDNPCNDVAVANTNENWSIGDFLGSDNDGNNVYDRLDPACSPYQILAIMREGNDVRVTWETTGGRTDVLQAAADVDGPYSDVVTNTIPGTSVITTNAVELGAASDPDRYYRIRLIP